MKPVYSIHVPDQQRLKIARTEIEALLKKHDLAGVVLLHTPGMTEFFYDIRPSYSCVWIDEVEHAVRIKSKLQDYRGNAEQQRHDQVATANMTRGLSEGLLQAASLFVTVTRVVDRATRAEHTPAVFTSDPNEGKRQ